MNKKSILKFINIAIIATIIYLSFRYMFQISKELSCEKVIAAFNSVQISYIIWALGLTILNYIIITFYDISVASQLKLKIPLKRLSLISLITFIINNNLGFGAFLGGILRFRFFTKMNINIKDIGKYLVILSWVYWVGLIFLSLITFLFIEPNYMFNLPFTNIKFSGYEIGIASLVILLAFSSLSIIKDIFNLKWKILFPIASSKRLVIITIISTLDWLLLSFVFYFLLPNGLSFENFFPIFLVAQIGAVTSHVPAGIGVFDSIIIYYLKNIFNVNTLFLSLLLYRVIYFILPMIIALLMLLIYEKTYKA